jgi:ribose transport system substrate-binding protein
MKRSLLLCVLTLAGSLLCQAPASADDVQLLPPSLMVPSSKDTVPAGTFKKDPPWTIGMSWPGVGNTWIVQTIQEIKYAGAQNPSVKEFRFVEANWQPAKQVADIEDLLAHKVDALIIVPISPEVVKAQVDAAVKAGIPVIVYGPSAAFPDATVTVFGGGEAFGKSGGEWLKDKLHGKGIVWAFRGIPASGEDVLRYNGFRDALKGTDIKIGAEVYGDWNYAKGKQLCENLVASGQPVDGIWFSGADMTRACFDVFKEIGKPLVPMTGEANNGFLRAWKAAGADSMGPIYTPGLGTATVKAAMALLEGKTLYKAYYSDPEPITAANFDKYYRPDLNDAYWFPSTLPENVIVDTFKK